MKQLLLFLGLFAALNSSGQCWRGVTPTKNYDAVTPLVTGAVIVDKSFRYFPTSGFSGFGVHAGVWVGWLGFTLGGVESKLNEKTPATREAVFTMYGRYKFIDERLQVSPYFSVGSNNYQDIGLRVGWKVLNSAYIGGFCGRTNHYGLTVMVSLDPNN